MSAWLRSLGTLVLTVTASQAFSDVVPQRAGFEAVRSWPLDLLTLPAPLGPLDDAP
jgi:hypothetical protein